MKIERDKQQELFRLDSFNPKWKLYDSLSNPKLLPKDRANPSKQSKEAAISHPR